VRWGPRLIDLDLLIFGAAAIGWAPSCTVPHPGIVKRNFVLYPLPSWHPSCSCRVAGASASWPPGSDGEGIWRLDNEATITWRLIICPHRFIVLEGPIGVGKTTLAVKLGCDLAGRAGARAPDENPFLERFYRNPRAGALPAQLYFLFQRTQQLAGLKQHDMFAPLRIADYLIDKDRLFARTTLDDEEYRLYEQVYAKLALDAPKPDLVIYLQAPVDVLLARIGRRGIAHEQFIDRRISGAAQRCLCALLSRVRWGAAADRQCGGHRSGRQRGGL
jgi:deoxyadenosine/deoxycytidine kinase